MDIEIKMIYYYYKLKTRKEVKRFFQGYSIFNFLCDTTNG
jgi:hypothetical protein